MSVKTTFSIRGRNPDVLTCIANLSNDEVFTPPELANAMLDELGKAWARANEGKDIWSDPTVKFLDPVAKSGVFLREITSRLTAGLEKLIPEIEDRVDHILTRQVFGIGVTELTSQLSRRSVYCSKLANGEHSIAKSFSHPEGNIWFERTEHEWVGGTPGLLIMNDAGETLHQMIGSRCKYCGASSAVFDRGNESETHAYAFIHTDDINKKIRDIFGEDMQFDVVIGNPPYQLNVGNTSGNNAKARAIYHEFVTQALALNPRYVSMVIPSRWMTRSTEGIPEAWIDNFIDDHRVRTMHDFLDSKICFPGVDIKGGVCYFLWDRDNKGKCEYVLHSNSDDTLVTRNEDYLNSKGIGIVVRDIQAMSVIEKIQKIEGDWLTTVEKNFSSLVSPKDFFTNKTHLTSSWSGFSVEKNENHPIKYYLNKASHKIPFGFIKLEDVPKNTDSIKINKVFIPAAAWGAARENDDPVLGRPFVGEANSVCSQTYLVIGYDPVNHNFSKEECENIAHYISTKFFRYLVALKKRTQNGPRQVYQFVPLQDFSKQWTDELLYKKYKLTEAEQNVIESAIRPMSHEDGGE